MIEQVMSELENSMVTGLQYEESYPDPAEPSYEDERQRQIDLDAALKDITLSQQIDKLESMIGRQAE